MLLPISCREEEYQYAYEPFVKRGSEVSMGNSANPLQVHLMG